MLVCASVALCLMGTIQLQFMFDHFQTSHVSCYDERRNPIDFGSWGQLWCQTFMLRHAHCCASSYQSDSRVGFKVKWRNFSTRWSRPTETQKWELVIRQIWQPSKANIFKSQSSRSQGKNYGTMQKNLSQTIHMQFRISSSKKVMIKIKVFQKEVKGQGHYVKNYGTTRKFLTQAIHICNMKALSLLVRG